MSHGHERIMDYSRGRCVRPFLATDKDELIAWATRHEVEWHEDSSNTNLNYVRNRIRHTIVPELNKINSGLDSVIRRKVVEKNSRL